MMILTIIVVKSYNVNASSWSPPNSNSINVFYSYYSFDVNSGADVTYVNNQRNVNVTFLNNYSQDIGLIIHNSGNLSAYNGILVSIAIDSSNPTIAYINFGLVYFTSDNINNIYYFVMRSTSFSFTQFDSSWYLNSFSCSLEFLELTSSSFLVIPQYTFCFYKDSTQVYALTSQGVQFSIPTDIYYRVVSITPLGMNEIHYYNTVIPLVLHSNLSSDSQASYDSGYQQGYTDGLSQSSSNSYLEGYNKGYEEGIANGTVFGGDIFSRPILTIVTAPITFISSVLDFNIGGLNIGLIIVFLITVLLAWGFFKIIIKIVRGG